MIDKLLIDTITEQLDGDLLDEQTFHIAVSNDNTSRLPARLTEQLDGDLLDEQTFHVAVSNDNTRRLPAQLNSLIYFNINRFEQKRLGIPCQSSARVSV